MLMMLQRLKGQESKSNLKWSIPTNSDFYHSDLGDDSNTLIVFPERINLIFSENVNRSPLYLVLISQVTGFAGRELCKSLLASYICSIVRFLIVVPRKYAIQEVARTADS